ncbi:MAG TPA: hypothetical protein VF518_16630 [Polyangia bacterium]
MRLPPLSVTVVAALVALAWPAPVPAQEAKPAPSAASAPSALPPDAAAALVRASAAYEYGDMNQVVEAARPVTEGLLPASHEEQVQALRLLGVGLYLTNRRLGAETAFNELLAMEPRARLDPTTTRPELVAFFEGLRHHQKRSTRKFLWNFVPPVGQFQNEDNTKGWVVLSVGVVSLVSYATSYFLLKSWQEPHGLSKHYDAAKVLRPVHWASFGLLAATYLYGVIDGLVGYARPIEKNSSLSLFVFPGGGGLGLSF